MSSLFEQMRRSESYDRLPIANYHLVVTREEDSRVVAFRGLHRSDFNPKAQYTQGDGWKIHLTIAPNDMKRAWDEVIVPILTKARVGAFKFVEPNEGIIDFLSPKGSQAGKMITVYGSGDSSWADIAKQLEIGLAQAGIRPGPSEIHGDRMVPGSRYIGYRNERNFRHNGNGTGYISSENIEALVRRGLVRQGQEHNPFQRPDSLQNIDFSNDPQVLAARGEQTKPNARAASARPEAPSGASKNAGHTWQPYESGNPNLGSSLRYTQSFSSRQEAFSLKGQLADLGITATVGNSDGRFYLYVSQSDRRSIAAIEQIHGKLNIAPPHAPEPSWLDRAKAWLGPKAATPSAHEASVHGRGIVAGAAMTVTAGGITLLTTSSPAEAAIAAGEQAVSAVPGASGLFANNADERAIRNKVDALGLAGAGAGAWAGGVAGTPLPVAGNAAGALLGGAAGNLLLSMGSDELLRLSARYLEGKKSTVQPSAGEQAVAALIHAGAITIDQVKKWIIEAHAHSEKHPPRVSEIDSKHASANLTLAQAKAQQIQRPQGISAASSPEAHNSMVASTPATSSPLRLG